MGSIHKIWFIMLLFSCSEAVEPIEPIDQRLDWNPPVDVLIQNQFIQEYGFNAVADSRIVLYDVLHSQDSVIFNKTLRYISSIKLQKVDFKSVGYRVAETDYKVAKGFVEVRVYVPLNERILIHEIGHVFYRYVLEAEDRWGFDDFVDEHMPDTRYSEAFAHIFEDIFYTGKIEHKEIYSLIWRYQ